MDYGWNLQVSDSELHRDAADEIERLQALADSEGSRAVEYLRRARKAEAALAQTAPTEQAQPAVFAVPYGTAPYQTQRIGPPIPAPPTAAQGAEQAAPQSAWQPIETAPKDRSVLLVVAGMGLPIYCGRERYGTLGEPQQGEFAWRCDSSGRFTTPTHWMPLPAPPDQQDARR
jgi:hypothetical protein